MSEDPTLKLPGHFAKWKQYRVPPKILIFCHEELVEAVVEQTHLAHENQREHFACDLYIAPASFRAFNMERFPLDWVFIFDFLLVFSLNVGLNLLRGPLQVVLVSGVKPKKCEIVRVRLQATGSESNPVVGHGYLHQKHSFLMLLRKLGFGFGVANFRGVFPLAEQPREKSLVRRTYLFLLFLLILFRVQLIKHLFALKLCDPSLPVTKIIDHVLGFLEISKICDDSSELEFYGSESNLALVITPFELVKVFLVNIL